VRFVVYKVELRRGLLPALRLTPVSIIPTNLHNLLHLRTAVVKRTSTGSLGTFPQTNALSDIGGNFTEKCFHNVPNFRRSTAVSSWWHCFSYSYAPTSFPHWMIQRHPLSMPMFPVSCIHYARVKERNTKNSSFGDEINRAKGEIKVQMLTQNEANIWQETQMESKILQCRKRVTPYVKIVQTELLGWVT